MSERDKLEIEGYMSYQYYFLYFVSPANCESCLWYFSGCQGMGRMYQVEGMGEIWAVRRREVEC